MSAIAASIALAPFENLSGDPSQDVLALGFVEDVASALSRFGAIEVVYPQAFAAASPGRSGSDPTANASNLLRGSVRRAGDVIRIAVQLLDTHTGRQLWADRHDVVRRLCAQEARVRASEIGHGFPPEVLLSPRVQRGAGASV